MNRVACVAFLFGSVLGCQPKSSDAVEPGSSANFKRGEFPALGKGKVVAPGVVLHEVNVGPPGVKRRLWVYMPEKPPAGKLPCVLIGGAGTRLFHGMALGDGDRPEHLPWVKAGFAVVAFDIDGDLQGDNPTNAQAFAAAKLFRDARAGRGNVKLAFDYVVEKIPDIDPKNASIVGHSSAATLALIAAADEKRLRACVAFAPATDVVTYLADGAEEFERPIPGFTRFIRDSSPLTQVGKISCPRVRVQRGRRHEYDQGGGRQVRRRIGEDEQASHVREGRARRAL